MLDESLADRVHVPLLAVSDRNIFFFRENRPFSKNSGLNPMSIWVLEVSIFYFFLLSFQPLYFAD